MTEQSVPLSTIIDQHITARLTPDFVEQAIAKKLDALIQSAIDDAFRQYNDIGKSIYAAVQASLQVGDLGLPAYGDTVAKLVRERVDAISAELIAGRLKDEMDDILRIAPKEIKLSEIVEAMKAAEKDTHNYGDEIYLEVEESDLRSLKGYYRIYLHPDSPERGRFSADIQIAVNPEGKVYGLSLHGRDVAKTKFAGPHYGVERLLFNLYACGSTLVIDLENVDRGYLAD